MNPMNITLVTHSRIKNPENLPSSGVWTDIGTGFTDSLSELAKTPGISLKYSVISLSKNYNEIREYLGKVAEAIANNPDVLILPLTPKQGVYEERLLKMLEEYNGIIIALNVPPDGNAMRKLEGKLRGYVGMNEIEAGRKAAKAFSGREFDCIYVPVDKPDHYGYSLRIKGIQEVYGSCGVPVIPVDMNDPQKMLSMYESMIDTAFITLGPVGTEFSLRVQKEYPGSVAGIVAMDLDQRTAEAIKSRKIICTLIQHPQEQGARAAKLAVNLLNGVTTSAYTEIFCGPTVVDLNNIFIFLNE